MWRLRTAAVLALTALCLPSNADGVLIAKQRPTIDPASYARDITEPLQKALIWHYGNTEHLVLQISYKGEASEFAWLVPTPSRPEVKAFDYPIFHELHQVTAPLVQYWFDADRRVSRGYLHTGAKVSDGRSVEVLEENTIGVYDIAVLRASEAGDLIRWLQDNKYLIPDELEPIAAEYIANGWVFTAMRINASHQDSAAEKLRTGTLQSLQFRFESPRPVYPLKISSLNSGTTDVLLYVYTDKRVESSLLKTQCSIPYNIPQHILTDDPRAFSRIPSRLTKFQGSLTPRQMTEDIVLTQAADQSIVQPGVVSPPLLDNIGAVSLLMGNEMLSYPKSVALLGLSALAALSPWGRNRWRVWLTGGIVVVILSVFNQGSMAPGELTNFFLEAFSFKVAGVFTLLFWGLCIVGIAYALLQRRHNYSR